MGAAMTVQPVHYGFSFIMPTMKDNKIILKLENLQYSGLAWKQKDNHIIYMSNFLL